MEIEKVHGPWPNPRQSEEGLQRSNLVPRKVKPFLGGLGSDYLGVAINHDRDMVETGDMILVYNTEQA